MFVIVRHMKKIFSLFLAIFYFGLAQAQTTKTVYATGSTGSKVSGYVSGSGTYTEGDVQIEGYGTAVVTPVELGGYFVFNLSTIPAGSTVTSVTYGYYETAYTAGSGAPYCTTYGFPGDLSKYASNGQYLFNNLVSGTPLSTTEYGTSVGNKTMTLNTAFFTANVGGKVSICMTAAGGQTRVYTVKGERGSSSSTTTTNHAPYLTIVYTAPAACSGTPVAGTAQVIPGGGNTTTGQQLMLTGTTTANGLTYRWQSSTNGTSGWANVSSATTKNWSMLGSATPVYYRASVKCGVTTVYSNTIQATYVPTVSCTPTYSFTNSGLYYSLYINPNTLGGDNGTSLSDVSLSNTLSYIDLTDNFNLRPVTLYKGLSHSLTVNSGGLNNPNECYVYIDYNNDGTFQSTELAGSTASVGTTATITLSAVPAGATTGIARMRLVGDYNAAPSSACAAMTNGETRDYLVNILPQPALNAASSLSFGSVNVSNYSSDQTLTFNASNLIPASGNITITPPANYYIHVGGVYYSTYSYAYTGGAIASGSVPVAFYPTAAGSTPGTLQFTGGGLVSATNVSVSGTGVIPGCSSVTWTAGNSVATPEYGNAGASVSLSLSGNTVTSGVTYQWYSSPDNSTWSTLGSASTNSSYATTLSGNTWYYCKATCTASTTVHSSVAAGVAQESCAPTISSWGTSTASFSYTGGAQTWTVPTGVTSITFDARGACGGFSYLSPAAAGTGLGGRVQGTLAVTPGQTLNIYVGGVGANGYNINGSSGGYNGGGNAPNWGAYNNGGGGGGATDIRVGGTALTDRLVVAGGGGGDGANSGDYFGGAGGGLTGGSGQCMSGGTAATGGASGAGGSGGGFSGYTSGTSGSLGTGGTNAGVCFSCSGSKSGICGGGGGGYYGGGGGGWGGGGGGSSYTSATYVTGAVHTQGYNAGAGSLSISYPYNNTANGISQFIVKNGATTLLSDASMNTAATPTSGYINRLTSSFTVTQGGTYASSVTWATVSSHQEVQVWVDFNDNNTFETTEEVTPVAGNGTGTTTSPTAFNITIPQNANPGNHKMRVRAIMEDPSNGYLADTHLDPCNNQYLPPTGSVYNSGDVADYVVKIQGLNVSAPVSDTLAFGTVSLGTYSSSQVISLSGSNLSPTSGTITISVPDGFYISDGSGYHTGAYNISYSGGVISAASTPAGSVNVVFDPAYNMPYSSILSISGTGAPTKYVVLTGTGTSPCTGTPSGGYSNVSPSYGTGGVSNPFVLSLTGVPTTSGLTYVWYSSPDNVTWTSLGSAATTATYSYTGSITSNTYFRCMVSCPAGGGSPVFSYSGSCLATYFSHAALCTPTAFNASYPTNASWTATTQTYSTPGSYTFVVPTGVTSVNVDVQGATGGMSNTAYNRAGNGGRVQGNMPVTAGQVLYINVGGAGSTGVVGVANGGYNGGGNGEANLTYGGGGGGGGSDIRLGSSSLTDRIFVAGGGGGAGVYNLSGSNKERGGDGGSTTTGTGAFAGENGYYGAATTGGGGGGTGAGGAGSVSFSPVGDAGTSGSGGRGSSPNASGGGGGGFYGGGGGSNNGGGGGSNYATASANNVVHTRGYNSAGDGSVRITYSNENTSAGIDGLFVTAATGSNLDDPSGIAAAANAGSGYVSRTNVAPITLYKGNSYASTVTWHTPAAYEEAQVWIDFSNFGTIETSEVVSSPSAGSSGGTAIGYSTTTPSGPNAFYINIPASAPTGTFLMRVRGIKEDPAYTLTGPSTYLDPCQMDYGGATTPAYLAGDIADYVVNITPQVAGMTITPSLINFGGVVSTYISPIQYVTIDASYLTIGGSITITPPAGFDINVGGTRYGANTSLCSGGSTYVYTYSGSSISGLTLGVEFTPTVTGVTGGVVSFSGGGLSTPATINVSGTGNPPCSGSPSGGTTTVTPTTGNSGTTFTLSNVAATSGGGIVYQWQSSPDLTSWSSISGATSTSYSFTGISSPTYYRLNVTCPFSSSTPSNNVLADYVATTPNCVTDLSAWTSEYGNIDSAMDAVVISIAGGTNLNSTGMVADANTISPSDGYLDRTATSCSLSRGGIYPVSVTWAGTPAGYNEAQIWVDFNDDGLFATSEEVSTVNGFGSSSNPTVFNISIPALASTGTHLLRVRGIIQDSANYVMSTHLDPCSYQYGGTDPQYQSGVEVDFKVNIQSTAITLGANPVTCQNVSTFITNLPYSSTTGSPNQYSLNWTGIASGVFSNVAYTTLPAGNIPISIPGGVSAGNYSGTITVRNSTSGAVSSGYPISVTVNSPYSIQTSSVNATATSVCSGTTISLSVITAGGSGVATYTWSGPGLGAGVTNTSSTIPYSGTTVLSPIVASGSVSGQYSFAITYSGVGCTSVTPTVASATVFTVTAQPTLSGTVSATTGVLCAGATEALSCNAVSGGPPTPTYTWSGPGLSGTTSSGNSVSATPTSTVTATGAYSLTVSYPAGSGCNTLTATPSATVTVNPQPVFSGSVTTSQTALCSGGTELLGVTAPTGGSGTVVYTWNGPGITTTTGTSNTSVSFTPTVATGTTGAYSVMANFSGGSCYAYATSAAVVTVNPQPSMTMSVSAVNLCSGGSDSLTALLTGGAGTAVYTWSGPGIATRTGNTATPAVFTPTVASVTSGNYSVSTVFSGGGCNTVSATSATVTIEPQPTLGSVSIGPALMCTGYPVTLSETGTPTVPGTGSNVYTWSGPAGVVATMSSVTGATSFTFSPTTSSYSGVYSLSASYGETGCTSAPVMSSSITVAPQGTGTLTLTYPYYICPGNSETLTANVTGGSGTPVFTWMGSGIASTVSTGSVNTYTVVPVSGGAYSVVATYSVTGCNADTIVSVPVDPVTQMWIGTINSDWNTAANWSCGTIPVVTDSVLIPAGTTYSATLLASANGYVGKLKIGQGAVVSLASNSVLRVYGDVFDTGAVTGAGKVLFTGASLQHIYGNGALNNVVLNNSAGATLNSNHDTLAVTGKLTLTNGNMSTQNTLILSMSDDPVVNPANGRLDSLTTGGGALIGKTIIQQYMKGGRRAYRFWATPFRDSIALSQIERYIDITGMYGSGHGFTATASNAASAYWYHTLIGNSAPAGGTGDPGWVPFTWCIDTLTATGYSSKDSNLVHPYQGIRLFFRGAKNEGLTGAAYTPSPVSVRMWGNVNTGNQNVTLRKGALLSGGSPVQDYNQIGNPYPSPVNIGQAVYNAWQAGDVLQPTIYAWNPFGGAAGVFSIVDLSTVHSYILSANTSIQVRAARDSGVIHFVESMKADTASAVLLKTVPNEIALTVYDHNYHYWDQLRVRFNEDATSLEDRQYDAGKPVNPDLNFYSWSTDHRALGIDTRPIEDKSVIPLGFTSNYKQQFIIRADDYAVPAGHAIYLHDKYLAQYVLLDQGTEYAFDITSDPATQGDDRFELGIGEQSAGKENNNSLKTLVLPNPATADITVSFVAPAAGNCHIRLLSLEGITVSDLDLGYRQSGSVILPLAQIPAGMYMVEFTLGSKKTVTRFVKE